MTKHANHSVFHKTNARNATQDINLVWEVNVWLLMSESLIWTVPNGKAKSVWNVVMVRYLIKVENVSLLILNADNMTKSQDSADLAILDMLLITILIVWNLFNKSEILFVHNGTKIFAWNAHLVHISTLKVFVNKTTLHANNPIQ